MWPWRLVTTSTGETFRFLRKLYHSLLNPQQSSLFRKYQHYEANVLLCDLLDRPEDFLQETERFAMSVIFSATYGVRIADLNHGMMREFYSIWDSCLRCECVHAALDSFCTDRGQTFNLGHYR